jgi:hypothetical protein
MLLAGRIDAERHDQTSLGEHDPVDKERHKIQVLQRRGLPRPHLRRRPRHEATTHTALARPVALNRWRERLQAESIAPRRDTQEHLFDDAPIERIGLGHGFVCREWHLLIPGPHARPANPDLLALRDWLQAQRVTHVALESTGVYWKPIYYVLEDAFTLILVNMQHLRHVPGRKSDVRDSEWLARCSNVGYSAGASFHRCPSAIVAI